MQLIQCDKCKKQEKGMYDELPKGWKSISFGNEDESGHDCYEFCGECYGDIRAYITNQGNTSPKKGKNT